MVSTIFTNTTIYTVIQLTNFMISTIATITIADFNGIVAQWLFSAVANHQSLTGASSVHQPHKGAVLSQLCVHTR